MAHKNTVPLKSYSKAGTSNRGKLDILHNILARRIEKKKTRKKLKIEIQVLPPSPPNTCFTNDSSLNLNCDNTFDRLKNATDYNTVKYKAMGVKSSFSCSNSSENCSSVQIKETIYSPMRTKGRRRKRIPSSTDLLQVVIGTPVITRSVSRKLGRLPANIEGEKENTLEKSIYNSLYIEKIKTDNQKPIALSFSNSIEQSTSVLKPCDYINDNSSINSSCGQMFTDTLKKNCNNFNKQTSAIWSTPVEPTFHQKILCDTISPIVNVENRKIIENETPKLNRPSRVRRSILLDNKIVNSGAIEISEHCSGNEITNLKSVDENSCKAIYTIHESDYERSMLLFEDSRVNWNYPETTNPDLKIVSEGCSHKQRSEFLQEDNISTADENKFGERQTKKDVYITVDRSRTPPFFKSIQNQNMEVSPMRKTNDEIPFAVPYLPRIRKQSDENKSQEIKIRKDEYVTMGRPRTRQFLKSNSKQNVEAPLTSKTNDEVPLAVSELPRVREQADENKSQEIKIRKDEYITMGRPRTRQFLKSNSKQNVEAPLTSKTNDEVPFAVSELPRIREQDDKQIRKDEYTTVNRPITRQFLKSNPKENVKAPSTSKTNDEVPFAVPELPPIREKGKLDKGEEFVLKPGKLWRRSLQEVRSSKIGVQPMRQSTICTADKGNAVCTCTKCKVKIIANSTPRKLSVRVVPLSSLQVYNKKKYSILENYAISCHQSFISNALQESLLGECFENLSLNKENSGLRLKDEPNYQHRQEVNVTARDVVLGKCGQAEPLSFEQCYPDSILQHCQKIGEGVYGEVFLFRRPAGGTLVIKVIPIEGDLIVNGEHQKKFEEILTEITIAMELSNLRENSKNSTSSFSVLHKVTCVKGKYPVLLQELWELFQENYGSENDHPDIFNDDQLYIVLELTNGGKDMESFVFKNARQAYAAVTQIACALAVAELSLEFEHRDLHWGNILLSEVDNDAIKSFRLNGKDISLKTHGAEVTIIDFTLSRISLDGVCVYNNLALDPDLFTATGDYQFELYRLMRQKNGDEWQHFEPYSNILWLHYVFDKASKAVRYRDKNTKWHRQYLSYFKKLKEEVLEYKSVQEFVTAKAHCW